MGNVKLYGASSGYVEIVPTAASGTSTLTLPAATGTLATTANITTAVDAVVPAGLVHINTTTFSAESSVSLDNVFTSTYDNYRLIVTLTDKSDNSGVNLRTRLAGSDDSASVHYSSSYYIGTSGAAAGSAVGSATTSWTIFTAADSTDATGCAFLDFSDPLSAKRKLGGGTTNQRNPSGVGYGYSYYYNKTATTAYDGLTLLSSTGTMTGTISVYGYKNGA